jgi:hypothetical protein
MISNLILCKNEAEFEISPRNMLVPAIRTSLDLGVQCVLK